MELTSGLIDGKYEILHKLGEGGMGKVYKVRHVQLDDVRVMKVIRRQPTDANEDAAGLTHRFTQEARIAARLRHPRIAQLYDFWVDDEGSAVIVMEFIDGMTVLEILKTSGPPQLGLTIEIALQGLDALAYLHEMGFIHRDISPDNLMVTRGRDGTPDVKLIDLGLAKSLQSSLKLTATGTFLGKVRYSAPEQFGDQGLDARCDIYSFGVMLYELLTGVRPISGEQFTELVGGHLVRPPRSFEETDPRGLVPPMLRQAVMRTLEKKPAQRLGSAIELARHLEPFRCEFRSPFDDEGCLTFSPPVTPTLVEAGMATGKTLLVGQVAPTLAEAPAPSAPAPSAPAPATLPMAAPAADGESAAVPDPAPTKRRWLALAVIVLLAAVVTVWLMKPELFSVTKPEPLPGEAEYRAALEKIARGEEMAAVPDLRDAIAAAPEERSTPVDAGAAGRVPYLPHYQLGKILERFNPLDAWNALQEAERQGVARQFHAEDLAARLDRLGASLVADAESDLQNAQGHAEIARSLLKDDSTWLEESVPEIVTKARALLDRLDAENKTLQQALEDRDYKAIGTSRTRVRELGDALRDLNEEIFGALDAVGL